MSLMARHENRVISRPETAEHDYSVTSPCDQNAESDEGVFLDLDRWNRRQHFELFKVYDNPYFNVCCNLDVTRLLEYCRADEHLSFFVAYLYLSMKTANETEPFRYRIREDRVFVHERIHGGTTVLLDDDAFSFCYFDYCQDFERFHEDVKTALDDVRSGNAVFDPKHDRDDLIYHTVLPWTSFTSVSHPQRRGRGFADSVPKIAFGKYFRVGERSSMPVSVEVHHGLMDGIHVARYLERLECAFAEPETSLQSSSVD